MPTRQGAVRHRNRTTGMVDARPTKTPEARAATSSKHPGVTPRELELIGLVLAGYTNRDLARTLDVSAYTVKHHLASILAKLGVSNRLELVLYAADHRLVSPGRVKGFPTRNHPS